MASSWAAMGSVSDFGEVWAWGWPDTRWADRTRGWAKVEAEVEAALSTGGRRTGDGQAVVEGTRSWMPRVARVARVARAAGEATSGAGSAGGARCCDEQLPDTAVKNGSYQMAVTKWRLQMADERESGDA